MPAKDPGWQWLRNKQKCLLLYHFDSCPLQRIWEILYIRSGVCKCSVTAAQEERGNKARENHPGRGFKLYLPQEAHITDY